MSVPPILPGCSEHRSWRKVGKWKVTVWSRAPCHPFCAPHSTADCTRLLCYVERLEFGFFRSMWSVSWYRCRYFRSFTQNIWNSLRYFNEFFPNLFARPFWGKNSRPLPYFFSNYRRNGILHTTCGEQYPLANLPDKFHENKELRLSNFQCQRKTTNVM